MTVLELLSHLEVPAGRVAVEVNREVVRRAEHETRYVEDGDAVEVIHFVGGG
jgi:thiamine biosynthesis protein ThiS